MMEKTPSSVSMGRRRCEMTWMPEKARDWSGIATFGVAAAGVFEEKPGGLFQAAAGVQQDVFAGDFDAHAEIAVRFQIVDDLIGEMVDVDDDLGDTESTQAGESDFEQGAA